MTQIVEGKKLEDNESYEEKDDEIDDMKENLEKKEYLLQLTEQRLAQFETILFRAAEYDFEIKRCLVEANLLPRERKISSVVSEN